MVTEFLADRQHRGLSSRTLDFYQGYLDRICAALKLGEATRSDIQSFLTNLSCSPGGKQAYLRAVRAFYFWAEETGLIRENPCRRLRIKVPKPLRRTVALSDLPVLLAACEGTRDRLVISLLADTGLRRSELAQVKLSDIDLDSSIIRVWGKGAKERVVRYGPSTAALLNRHLQEQSTPDTLLGLNANGIATMLRRLGASTGIKCNPHSLRRTFATESIRNGMNVFHVQSLLGHSSLTMTRIYAEQVNSEDAVKAYKPIVS